MTGKKFKEAELLLRIYALYSSDPMVDAFTWFYKDFQVVDLQDYNNRYPLGSEGRKYFNRLANLFDLLGIFIERKYITKKLIIEFCPDDVKSFWEKSKLLISQMRSKWNDPTLWVGLETLNRSIINWEEKLKKQKRVSL
ncbi:MAG: hypothetical protein ACFFB0_19125 [Promethearchaeota archaeon]